LLTVADVVDDQRSWINPGTSQYKALSSNYEEVLSLSDVVLANCAPVQERMRWFGADPVLIPNAMEVPRRPLYRRRAPAELRRLAGPIIGYVGNLGSRIDLPLLERIADERDDWQLVVIGSAHLSDDVLALDQRRNVHFLGVRRYPDVMRYIRSFDVAIIPHRDDALTRSMNPLKAYVYAGCGVPVVTTDVANLPDLGGGIRVAATHDEFILALGETIAQERSEACPQLSPEVIERHSWNQRVAQIERILDTAGAAVEAKSRTTT
jgi:glycosyltransferase involved in cell wall biosynthesis